jgi:hypothetical protein
MGVHQNALGYEAMLRQDTVRFPQNFPAGLANRLDHDAANAARVKLRVPMKLIHDVQQTNLPSLTDCQFGHLEKSGR